MNCDGKKKGECLKSGLCEWELRTLVGKSKRKGFCINKKSKSKKKWQKAFSKIKKSNKAKKNWNKAMSNVRRRKPITIYFNQLNNFPAVQNMSSNTSEGNNGESFGESPLIYPLVKDWNAKTEDFVLLNTILDTSTSKSTLKTLYESITNVKKKKLITLINICLRLGVELESELWIYLTQNYFNRIKDIKLKESKTLLDIMKVELYNDDLADYIYEKFSDEYKLVRYIENSKDPNTELTQETTDNFIHDQVERGPIQSWFGELYTEKKGSIGLKRYGGVRVPPNGNVVIPYLITSIGADAFNDCNMMTGITIPNSVTSISKRAFKYCKSLENIIIPDSVKTIANQAFSTCWSLKNITISNSVTKIEQYTFDECVSLERLNIPESVTTIGDGAFSTCTSLKNVTIPDSVTTIEYGAFWKCQSLESIIIPDSVTKIGNNTFYDCRKLKNVTISNSLTKIPLYAFEKCKALKRITIPDSVTNIGNGAFSYCRSLESITIPDSVTIIGKKAFKYCTSLKSITIPDSVVHIKEEAFHFCTSLTTITIPPSVKKIDKNAFDGCSSLRSINKSESSSFHKDAFPRRFDA